MPTFAAFKKYLQFSSFWFYMFYYVYSFDAIMNEIFFTFMSFSVYISDGY